MSADLKELICNRLWQKSPLIYAGVIFYEDGKGYLDVTIGVNNMLHSKFTWRELPCTPQAEEQAEQDEAAATILRFKIQITLLKPENVPGTAAFVHETMYNDRIYDTRTFEISLEQGRWELKQPETNAITNKMTPYARRLAFEPSILPEAGNFKKGEPRRLLGLYRFNEWKSFYSEQMRD
ncbi:hypothetical protein MCOR25_007441 [Pyricularia grisea]|uniref:Uncharacterized protein n=1 Tax=Pyricularia grisea TaxID=148305 RepID=A0A6P8BJT7_PYRGI|nr:uncharacterized protein PgNI_01402 [Pyricularia grisea]KAI6358021.1 hypothetical protein MCOR25_007441 [Pyricularia grisea]TLD17053.1 hypothetical protein PgNI_01402 [Pyricularia grisea]